MADKIKKEQSPYNRKWILETGIPIIESYRKGTLTVRSLHYRLVAAGMTNDEKHYRKVVQAMIDARWTGDVSFDAFSDHERESMGKTKYETTNVEEEVKTAVDAIGLWSRAYFKNRWENQPNYVEVFIEKKALQGVFQRICEERSVALNPCKGYPSLTFLYDASNRFKEAIDCGKNVIILYFGDYDCSGEDIPRSIQVNFEKMGAKVEVRRVALMEHQVVEWNLPPAPTKKGDARAKKWDGLGQVELDAVLPNQIQRLLINALDNCFDNELYQQLKETEKLERQDYRDEIKQRIIELFN